MTSSPVDDGFSTDEDVAASARSPPPPPQLKKTQVCFLPFSVEALMSDKRRPAAAAAVVAAGVGGAAILATQKGNYDQLLDGGRIITHCADVPAALVKSESSSSSSPERASAGDCASSWMSRVKMSSPPRKLNCGRERQN